MLRALVLGLCGLLTTVAPALSAEWFTERVGSAVVTSAYIEGNRAIVRCDAGMLTFAVGVRRADVAPELQSAGEVFMVNSSDPSSTGETPAFTARTTIDMSGDVWTYTLSPDDSVARLAAMQQARTRIQFALMTEPGGERLNVFYLPVAGAADALREVITACGGEMAPPATERTAAAEQPAAPAATAPAPAAKPATRPLPPIGPGPLADNTWHLSDEDGRVSLYRRTEANQSLTFECYRDSVAVTLGVAMADLDPAIAEKGRVSLLMLPSEELREEASRVERDGVAYYRTRGAAAETYLQRLLTVGEAAVYVATRYQDPARHQLNIDPRTIKAELKQVLDACNAPPSEAGQASAESSTAPEPAPSQPASTQTSSAPSGSWQINRVGVAVEADITGHVDGVGGGIMCFNGKLQVYFIRAPGQGATDLGTDAPIALMVGTDGTGGTEEMFASSKVSTISDGRTVVFSEPGQETVVELMADLVKTANGRIRFGISLGDRQHNIIQQVSFPTAGAREAVEAALEECSSASSEAAETGNSEGTGRADMWTTYEDGAGFRHAVIRNENGVLDLQRLDCNEIGMSFDVPLGALPPDIAGLSSVDVEITADGQGREFLMDVNKRSVDGNMAIRVALDINGILVSTVARAQREVGVGLADDLAQGESYVWTFAAKGSTAAIKYLREGC